jgi:hypothetical protein
VRRTLVPKPAAEGGLDAPLQAPNSTGGLTSADGASPASPAYYTADDLAVGAEINLFGRAVRLTDCDGFTRHPPAA